MSAPRKWPYVTIIIILGSVVLYALRGEDLLRRLAEESSTGQILAFFFRPFAHSVKDPWHLVGDIILGFFVMGTLIESWVALNWKYRYTMYGLAYISSPIADMLLWKWLGPTIGLSGFVCGGSALLLSYYTSSFRKIPIRRFRDTLGPLGEGYLIPFVIWYIPYAAITYPQNVPAQNTAIFHSWAFFFGLVFAVPLLLRRQFQELIRRQKWLTSYFPTKEFP